ncbi:transposable element Tcb1 transposase [Trichonephila clavipes]|nr:transposable element Tcb1 transposase [Trichonephila clavipes]
MPTEQEAKTAVVTPSLQQWRSPSTFRGAPGADPLKWLKEGPTVKINGTPDLNSCNSESRIGTLHWPSPDTSSMIVRTQLEVRFIAKHSTSPVSMIPVHESNTNVTWLGYVEAEIGSRVGRNQTTVMRICDRWMQKSTMARGGRSHPPQGTTSREDRQIMRMAVKDRSVTSRTIAQHTECVTHHSVSARTIRRHLQQSDPSARLPLLGLPLTQNHRRLRRNGAMKEGCERQNEMKLCLY